MKVGYSVLDRVTLNLSVVYISFYISPVLSPGSFLYHTDQSGHHVGRPAHQPIPECELSQCYHFDPICASGEHHLPTPQPVPGPDVSTGKPKPQLLLPQGHKCPVTYWVKAIFFFFFWLHHAAFGMLAPRLGIEPGPAVVKAPSPNHWTTRECPEWKLFYLIMVTQMF